MTRGAVRHFSSTTSLPVATPHTLSFSDGQEIKYIKYTAKMDNITLHPTPTRIRNNFLMKVSNLRHLPPTIHVQ